jgi:uncharacterized glyoxalase superfamily protein PhnB
MLVDENLDYGLKGPITLGGSPVTVHLIVDDADAWFDRAVAAGATPAMPVADQFWGDRYGVLIDPFGHAWAVASRIGEPLTSEQLAEAAQQAAAQM